MGRWAQSQRTASSVATAAAPAQLSAAFIVAPTKAEAFWSKPVPGGALLPADFTSQGSGRVGTVIFPTGPSSVEITFSGAITGDGDLEYSGATPGLKTPDTVQYS